MTNFWTDKFQAVFFFQVVLVAATLAVAGIFAAPGFEPTNWPLVHNTLWVAAGWGWSIGASFTARMTQWFYPITCRALFGLWHLFFWPLQFVWDTWLWLEWVTR